MPFQFGVAATHSLRRRPKSTAFRQRKAAARAPSRAARLTAAPPPFYIAGHPPSAGPCGGTGRRARLKIEFRKECWFDSGQGHQLKWFDSGHGRQRHFRRDLQQSQSLRRQRSTRRRRQREPRERSAAVARRREEFEELGDFVRRRRNPEGHRNPAALTAYSGASASRRKRLGGSTKGGAIFRRDGLFSAACATFFRRAGARRGLGARPMPAQ